MRVLLLNNYPMDRAWKRWRAGEAPSNHVWGAAELPRHDIHVVIPRHRVFGWLAKYEGLTERFGNCDQQLRALLQVRRVDVLYAAHHADSKLLAALKRRGRLRTPLVSVMHRAFTPATGRWEAYFDGHDLVFCLSDVIRRELDEAYPRHRHKFRSLPWGVDLAFYPDLSGEPLTDTGYVFAAGKTFRDYETLVAAARETPHPLFISCDRTSAPAVDPAAAHIRVRTSLRATNHEVIEDYRQALVVAIPLAPQVFEGTLFGLTSLLEAMALGKPVIMTRNPTMGIDIEREGIGIWVEPGDPRGWAEAIRFLFTHPEAARDMGRKGRRLCEEQFSMERFSATLAGYLREVAG